MISQGTFGGTEAVKNAIVYLIRGTESSLSNFSRSVALLKENFLPWNTADIIVFHEGNVSSDRISNCCGSVACKTALVDFSDVPAPFLDHPIALEFGLGYRHMCHFFANDIFLREELRDYDYYMRLDDDSFILSPVEFDVFELMRQGGYRYGYRAIDTDADFVCQGLWDVSKRYFDGVGVSTDGMDTPPPYKCFYTNFEICDLDWFRGDPWRGYFEALEKDGGIWRKRWGDAPIRYIGVKALLPKSQVRCFTEFHYFHQTVWRKGYENRLRRDNPAWWLQTKHPAFCRAIERVMLSTPFVKRLLTRFNGKPSL